jgi:VWFA-related protein
MKKLAIWLFLGILGVTAANLPAQTPGTRTRPRRVGDGRPAPAATPAPVEVDDAPAATVPNEREPGRRPPTLGGENYPGGRPEPTPDPQLAKSGPQEVDEDEVIKVSTTLVTVPVSVLDRNGKYIPNLRQRDFQLFEDNQQQEVAYFTSVEAPFTVALIIDTSGSTQFKLNEIQDAAIAFVNQLRPDDKVMVVTFDEQIRVLSEPTNNRYALRDAIRQATVGGNTKLYDALDYVMNVRFHRIAGRKAIVLFTDGVDTTSKRANYQSTLQDAEELDALIYPVQYDTFSTTAGGNTSGGGMGMPRSRGGNSGGGILGKVASVILNGGITISSGRGSSPGGAGTTRAEYERANEYLGELAERTGARRYEAATMGDVNQSFALVAEELRRQYSLGYYPKNNTQAGTRRRIRVRVNRPDLVVRARDSYVYKGGGNAPTATDAQNPQKPELKQKP